MYYKVKQIYRRRSIGYCCHYSYLFALKGTLTCVLGPQPDEQKSQLDSCGLDVSGLGWAASGGENFLARATYQIAGLKCKGMFSFKRVGVKAHRTSGGTPFPPPLPSPVQIGKNIAIIFHIPTATAILPTPNLVKRFESHISIDETLRSRRN